jgi:DNA-directed RNA polymerase I, II, and III subunit RPABC1
MERAQEICLEMLNQRGYTDIKPGSEEITARKPDNMSVVVYFASTDKFNVKDIQYYISDMQSRGIRHTIIIYKNLITPFTQKATTQFPGFIFELVPMCDLQYNITKHVLQPIYHRLTPSESKQFKKQYGTRFGLLRNDDPMARFYGYKRGDVIKIDRRKFARGGITYRLVI